MSFAPTKLGKLQAMLARRSFQAGQIVASPRRQTPRLPAAATACQRSKSLPVITFILVYFYIFIIFDIYHPFAIVERFIPRVRFIRQRTFGEVL